MSHRSAGDREEGEVWVLWAAVMVAWDGRRVIDDYEVAELQL